MASQPIDNNGRPIPVLRAATIINTDVDGTTDRTLLGTTAAIFEVAATVDCWLRFGDSTVTVAATTGMFFPKGVAVYSVSEAQTHLAYIDNGTTGRISITELE